ncbi:MAG: FKBP-type peptidyl-prolyl cis-trans isomerase [Gammaproteobacteria bacterium]
MTKKAIFAFWLLVTCLPLAEAADPAKEKELALPSGLKYVTTAEGSGEPAKAGNEVTVRYRGWLDEAGKKGKQFDSTEDHGKPFKFTLGEGLVIKGWEEGIAGMKKGEERTLFIPSDLGYGKEGTPGGPIPPNANLIFDVKLLRFK